jgi:8-oxo-dGTP pyrophosphatase MutT (NUDIX family)
MNLNKLKNYMPKISDHKENKEFSVLIPLVNYKGQICIVFQVRSGRLFNQPNEICFPGGKIELGETPRQAAIRETCEEMLIAQESIEVLSEIDTLVTPFNTIIYPFAALLHNYQGTFSSDEVHEVFYVPLDFLSDYSPECSYLDVQMKPINDFPFDKIQYGKDYPWAQGKYPVYIYQYQDKIIWGITARILKNFIELIDIE